MKKQSQSIFGTPMQPIQSKNDAAQCTVTTAKKGLRCGAGWFGGVRKEAADVDKSSVCSIQ